MVYFKNVVILYLLIFFATHSKGQENAMQDYTLLVCELEDDESINARNVVGEKWGIKFQFMEDCNGNASVKDSVLNYNNEVTKTIKSRFGEDWKLEFDKQKKIELERQRDIRSRLDKLDFIKAKKEKLALEGNTLAYYLTPIPDTREYMVAVNGWINTTGKKEWLLYYKMKINTKTGSYNLISDEIEKLKYVK